ncbi:MAG: Mur ligase domain-containing protein [Chitinispirillia bacterium]|nr:Mur ligase domain-containing protein [Chitinispirillia bacterium]MCL2241536.1 Mur ligase domain-containing protein [Chitinispirillia bacterium]
MSISINGTSCSSVHFTGIFGSGMSAIAQYLAWNGVNISGSDRLTGSADSEKVKNALLACGCSIHPQNGSGIGKDTGAVCVSTAIEEDNPDIAAARKFNVPVVHRSDVLAAIVRDKKSVAVAGTSGKSTVTAMIFELLTACGKSPSLISGAALRRLEEKGLLGNAFSGDSGLLVIEADESDGTLVKYSPYASVILNISKDHKPEEEVLGMFKQLIGQSKWSAANKDDSKLNTLGTSTTFGFGDMADFKGTITKKEALSVTVTVNGTNFTLPVPGEHNAANLLSALCVCKHLGCDDPALAAAAAGYKGVERRFAIHRSTSGVTVIDDFAHNPEKIRAAVNAAKNLSSKMIAVYQPHGFGPTRFLKNEYAAAFREIFRDGDTLCLLPIYYAGGTAVKDISSQDIITLMGEVPFNALAVDGRDDAINTIKSYMRDDTCVLLMGARDPSLPAFAKKIVESL